MTRAFVKGYGPACPYCGDIMSRRMGNGWSEPNDDYLRYKKCNGCGEHFATVEVVVPPDVTTFYRLDHHGRRLRRERWRARYGKTGRRLRSKEERSDQLLVKVKVLPSPDFGTPTECARGHPWTPENTYTTPSTKWRRCKRCRELAVHSYYLEHKDTWNKKRIKQAAP